MTWLAWRQARTQIVVVLAAVATIAVAAVAAGRSGSTLRLWLSVLVVVLPGVLGVFWGAPLVAGELESGSFRLAWTQDVSRICWLTRRLTVQGLAAIAVAGMTSWLVTWWAGPLDRASPDRFGWFDSRGIVAVGYAAFAFALGALLGALLRRTVPAMAATLVAFTATRLTVRLLVRPDLLAPTTRVGALDPSSTGYGSAGFLPVAPPGNLQPAAPDLPDAWVTSVRVVDRRGNGLTARELHRTCPGIGHRGGGAPPGGSGHGQAPPSVVNAMHECVTRIAASYHEVVTYQPAGRYWPLQWWELGLYLAAALLLAGACAWRVLRIG